MLEVNWSSCYCRESSSPRTRQSTSSVAWLTLSTTSIKEVNLHIYISKLVTGILILAGILALQCPPVIVILTLLRTDVCSNWYGSNQKPTGSAQLVFVALNNFSRAGIDLWCKSVFGNAVCFLMVKSVVGANVGHCLVMRHHYMRLMTHLQQPSEQYWLIAVLSHGKSLCASSPHLHREQQSCWSGRNWCFQMTQPRESLGLAMAESSNLNVPAAFC